MEKIKNKNISIKQKFEIEIENRQQNVKLKR